MLGHLPTSLPNISYMYGCCCVRVKIYHKMFVYIHVFLFQRHLKQNDLEAIQQRVKCYSFVRIQTNPFCGRAL